MDGSPLTAQFLESEGWATASDVALTENGECASQPETSGADDGGRLQDKQVDLIRAMLQGMAAQQHFAN